jgi:non-specific serine/threonine protein kinase/serine/threonine-protein kinase
MTDDPTNLDSTELPPTASSGPEPGHDIRQIGPYRLLEKVGEGGMGEVWLAEQGEPVKRRVALKVIKQGMDSKQVVARFEAERQALAMMNHPAVARVFDAGATPQGRPYFAMEYVQGVPITEFCDRHKLSNRERLELFMQVCEGVQHAHQKAIIHRDLKPSNVLVMTQDGERIPKIIDFGVAKATAQKLTEKTLYTQLGVLIGTPEYMSPEQAEMTGEDVDTRTDVYSLGVMLYELLVGALPFDPRELRSAGLEGIRKKIREEEPPTPSRRVITLGDRSTESANRRSVDRSTLQRELRGDLDWITMKSLEKDRTRRYGSPSELAADIARFLHNEPVLACPPSTAYRVGKFVRRHRLGVVAAMVLVLGLAAGIVGSTVGLIRAQRSEARALEEARRSERVSGFLQRFLAEVSPERLGDVLLTDLRKQVRESRSRDGRTEQATRSALNSLDDLLVGVYLADTGVELIHAEVLEPVEARIEDELGDDPVVAARLYHTIGEIYASLDRNTQAIDAHERALELRRQSLGEDHEETLRSMHDLALVYWKVGRKEEHLELVSAVAERGRRVLGEEHLLTLVALGEVADARMYPPSDAATIKEAEEQRIALMEMMRRVLGDEHRETLYSMDLVAQIFGRRGDLEQAESLYREELEIKRRVLGEEDPATLATRFNLAGLADRRGAYEEAESVYLEILELGSRKFGETSQFVVYPLVNLGSLCYSQGRDEEAAGYQRRALEGLRRSLGENSPAVIHRMNALAKTLSRKGDHAEAEALFLRALAIARDIEDPRSEAYARLGLARLYLAQGHVTRADSYFDRALEFLEASVEANDVVALAAYHVLAGNHDKALGSLKKAVDLGFPRVWINTNREFAPLHGNPEFEALVADSRT